MKITTISIYFTILTLLTPSCLTIKPVRAQVAEAAGAASTSVVLGSIRSNLLDLLDSSMDRVDYSVAQAAIKMLQALDTWEKVNSNLMDKAFSGLDEASRNLFSDANAFLQNTNEYVSQNVKDIDDIVIKINQISESMIFGDKRSYILNQSPLVVPKNNDDSITVRLTGVNLDVAEPNIFLDGEAVTKRILGPTLVEFEIPKESLVTSNEKLALTTFDVEYKTRDGSFLFVFPSYKDVKTQIRLAGLPDTLGSYNLQITKNVVNREVKEYTADGGKFKGRNTTRKKVMNPENGFKWLIDDRSKFKVVSTGSGEAGKCHDDIWWNDSNEHGITISARLDEIKEVKLTGVKFKDGYKHCGLRGLVYKDVTKSKTEVVANGTMGWMSDIVLDFPNGTTSFRITFTNFEGKTSIIDNSTSEDKYFKVVRSDKSIILKPKQVTDFI